METVTAVVITANGTPARWWRTERNWRSGDGTMWDVINYYISSEDLLCNRASAQSISLGMKAEWFKSLTD